MTNTTYNPSVIEPKWQKKWEDQGLYKTRDPKRSRRKKYILDMYPYPSGAVLHVGHMEGYVGTDVVSRYYRMKGFSVLHPMGWDAFGLPAENYAIKTGVPPDESTHKNIDTFRKQLKMLGLSYDWEREIDTSSPDYYKWTQWLFTVLFKMGLAYKKKAPANWCPKDETVLANEQVEDGKCERCGTEVIQKDLDQWFFKITAYADALIDGLDKIDWPKSTKLMQKNWIGKKEGLIINHKVKDLDLTLGTFTAFPAWIWADTYIAISPRHPMVKALVKRTDQEKAVLDFVKKYKPNKESKEGIFTGRYAIDPISGEEMPIWLANFALMEFGTGMIRCSCHDPRDYEFATKYKIALKEVVAGGLAGKVSAHENQGTLINSGPFNGRDVVDVIPDMCDWVVKKGFGTREVTLHLRDWLVSRQRYWGAPIPMIYCQKCQWQSVPEADLPVMLPTDVDFEPKGESPIAKSKTFQNGVKCPNCGSAARREVDTMDTFVDSSWYFLRFLDPKNDNEFAKSQEIAKWMPVDIYVGGGHTVQHLLFARFFQKALVDAKLVDPNLDEPFDALRVPGWILGPDSRKMSKRWNNVITPDEVVSKFGADTMRIYEMFMAPFEVDKPWNTGSVAGVYRFVNRIYRLTKPIAKTDPKMIDPLAKLVEKVENDIVSFNFNTAISSMMAFVNLWERSDGLSQEHLEVFLKILAPFAPHLTEELWGKSKSIHLEAWPVMMVQNKESIHTIIVTVNGKVRGTIQISSTEEKVLGQTGIVAKAQSLDSVAKYLTGQVKKTIYVPEKVINFVV